MIFYTPLIIIFFYQLLKNENLSIIGKIMKILFIYPDCMDAFRKGNRYKWMHHGLSLLSSCCKIAGYQTELIDMRTCRNWKDYKNKLRGIKPDIIAITALTIDLSIAQKCIEIAKEIMPFVSIVIGGIHAEYCSTRF